MIDAYDCIVEEMDQKQSALVQEIIGTIEQLVEDEAPLARWIVVPNFTNWSEVSDELNKWAWYVVEHMNQGQIRERTYDIDLLAEKTMTWAWGDDPDA